MTESASNTELWPEDRESEPGAVVATLDGPDVELAIILLASGAAPEFIKTRAGFETVAAVRLFSKDDDVRLAIKERRAERTQRVGDRALVRLERLLARPLKDTKAEVMAIRTALGVGQAWNRDAAPQTKEVTELSVTELEELIAMTRREIQRRTSSEADALGEYPPHARLKAN